MRRRPGDLISLMAHAEATRHQTPMEYLGNLLLLIVGGNDTTRNSITGGAAARSTASPTSTPSCWPTRASWPAWCRRSSAGRRRSPICAAPRRAISTSSGQHDPRRATASSCGTSRGNRDEEVIARTRTRLDHRPRDGRAAIFQLRLRPASLPGRAPRRACSSASCGRRSSSASAASRSSRSLEARVFVVRAADTRRMLVRVSKRRA